MSTKIREIGGIGNYYGGLAVREQDGKFEWAIENWDGYHWEDIPESLYRALIAYQEARP